MDFYQALSVQARISRRPRGVYVLRTFWCLGGGSRLAAPRAQFGGEDIMNVDNEAGVASRFDALHGRFKSELGQDDPRLQGIVDSFLPLDGRRLLDLGCGKGRFSRALAERGAVVVGLDLSAAMLHGAANIDRVRASA